MAKLVGCEQVNEMAKIVGCEQVNEMAKLVGCYAAFHLGLHCLSKSLYIQNKNPNSFLWTFEVFLYSLPISTLVSVAYTSMRHS